MLLDSAVASCSFGHFLTNCSSNDVLFCRLQKAMTSHLLPKARPAKCASISDGYCLSILSKVGCHHGYKQPLTVLQAHSPPLHDVVILNSGSTDG